MFNRASGLALALLLGIAGCEEPASPSQQSHLGTEQNGQPTPDAGAAELALPDLQGEDRRIADFRGEVVLVNFWATWCAPCLREIPALREVRRKYRNQGFEVLGIAIDQRDPVVRFVEEQHIEYPVLDGEGGGMKLLNALGNETGAIPFSVIVDRQGEIRSRHMGELTSEQMEEEIEKLL